MVFHKRKSANKQYRTEIYIVNSTIDSIGSLTLLPDVHFLEQLWQEPISPPFTIVNWLLPKLLQKVHIYTGAGSKVLCRYLGRWALGIN